MQIKLDGMIFFLNNGTAYTTYNTLEERQNND
jgi:hypothetical protein